MSTVTNYLALRQIRLESTQWYSDFNYNLARIDLVGKHLRLQSGAGQSLALRAELTDGTLAEALRVVPEDGSLAIYLGRRGRGDRVHIEGASLYASVALANVNPSHPGTRLSLGATWTDEDAGGDGIQNTQVLLNPRNNVLSVVELPPAQVTGITDRAYLGSAVQLELDGDTGDGTGKHFLKITVSTTTGAKGFLVPCYKI